MTVIAPATTYGIDTKIKQVQNYLDDGLTWTTPLVYGRIYRNLKQVNESDVVIPEVYSSSKEYKQIFIDDKSNAQIGFYVTSRDGAEYTAEVDIIFTGNLIEIYGASALRLDEKAIVEAKRVLIDSGLLELLPGGFKYGIAEVFNDFEQSQIKHRDMHPFFVFSYSCLVPYTEDFCK